MYRDFSIKSKQNLLELVSQVEDEKLNDFTDWVGDRWLDFESWIGSLNIKNYVGNVNAYHKKVIDRQNYTAVAINDIFAEVARIDSEFAKLLTEEELALIKLEEYVATLIQTIHPENANIGLSIMPDNSGSSLNDPGITESGNYSYAGKLFSKLLKLASELSKNDDNKAGLTLSSSAMSYVTGLYTFLTSSYNEKSAFISGGLKLAKSSASVWSGIYKYFDSTLKPLEASRLSKRFGSINNCVSIGGAICGFSSDTISMIKTLMDVDADIYQKTDQFLNDLSGGIDLGHTIIKVKLGKKQLRRTPTAKYEWRESYTNKSTLKKVGTIVDVADVLIDTVRGFVSSYGRVTEDGTLDAIDMSEIGIYSSVRGLTSIIVKATFGVSDALGLSDNADNISAGIVNFTNTTGADYVQKHEFSSAYKRGAQGMMDYVNNQESNIIGRIAVSGLAGAGMITAVAIDGVADVRSIIEDGAYGIGKMISAGWSKIFG